MVRLRFVVFAFVLAAIAFSGTASAQTPAKISVLQGNGQMICDGCTAAFSQFDYLVVLVTDAAGNPVRNAVVTWQVTSSQSSMTLATGQTQTGTSAASSAPQCLSNTVATPIGQSCNQVFEGLPATPDGGALVSTVTASLNNGASVTFYLTQSPPYKQGSNNLYFAQALVIVPQPGTTFQGPAGTQYPQPITVQVTTYGGTTLPNVSVRIVPHNPPAPISLSCVTGAGADPGTVFTDSNGNANCYVQFGSVPSPPNGSQELFDALVGGVASLQNPNLNNGATGVPFGYSQPSAVYAVVTPSTPGAVKIVSGNNQSANPGAAVAAPLVVQALDTSGNPLAGLPVSWAISPSTGGVVNPVNANTDANGQASATVTLSSSAVGNVAVNAKVTGNGVTVSSQAFTITVNTQVTGLTIASGNNQSAQVGQPFAQPLVVQVVTAGGQNVQGLAVQFAVTSGSGTLSASSAATGPTGLAQVNATAGGTAGPLTVVASIAGITQTFSLTVTPPPPPISSNSFLNGAGFYATSGSQLTALSPCSVGTIVVGNPLAAAAIPTTLNMFPAALQQPGNVSVSIGTTAVPILNVSAASTGQQLITFQQPCELPPANYTYTITINGVSTQIPNVTVRPGSPGIFEIISSDGVRRTLAVRPDGSIVSLQNPARRGEFVRIYITGVGPMQPALVTGQLPTPGVDSIPVDPNQVVVGLNGNGVGAVTVRAAPDLLGVAIVAFQVPIDATPSNNGVLAVGVTALGNPTQYQQPGGSKLPIQ